MERLFFIKGKVEGTIPEHAPGRIALLRLDTDWYERNADDYISPRAKNARNLANELYRLPDVFQHICEQHRIEGLRSKWQGLIEICGLSKKVVLVKGVLPVGAGHVLNQGSIHLVIGHVATSQIEQAASSILGERFFICLKNALSAQSRANIQKLRGKPELPPGRTTLVARHASSLFIAIHRHDSWVRPESQLLRSRVFRNPPQSPANRSPPIYGSGGAD